MKLFECQNCGQVVYFENTHCEKCGYQLGFLPEKMDLLSLVPISTKENRYRSVMGTVFQYKYCNNATYRVCNWLLPADHPDHFCKACALNRTIPDLRIPKNLLLWRRLEAAKHRLVYTLLRLGLPVSEEETAGAPKLQFDFLADLPGKEVWTGHRDGVITIDIEEADELERTRAKTALGEKYRTLLGHFRHEIGHYYWNMLVAADPTELEAFRQLFGDERADYQLALREYYANGTTKNWQERYISVYAGAHPWEDWAETWAHYLHIMDTLETGFWYGIRISPRVTVNRKQTRVSVKRDPFPIKDFDDVVAQWVPLSNSLNSMNRSMGQPDFYPFIIAPKVIEKFGYIHKLCKSAWPAKQ